MLDENGNKKCPRCGETKPPKAFYKHSQTLDRLGSNCKVCVSNRSRELRIKNTQINRAKSQYENENKYCGGCETTKPPEDFYKDSSSSDGLDSRCKACVSDREQKRAAKDIKKHRERKHVKHIKEKYGIDAEREAQIFQEQDNRCAVCKEPFSETIRPHIDHCHECPKTTCIRGILCSLCNHILGRLGDTLDKLHEPAMYGGRFSRYLLPHHLQHHNLNLAIDDKLVA